MNNDLNTKRQQLRNTMRAAFLSSAFQQHRIQLIQHMQILKEEEFQNINSQLDEFNLQIFLGKLLEFSQDINFCYLMIRHECLLVEFILKKINSNQQNHMKEALEILINLSNFEEIDFPQDEETVSAFVSLLFKFPAEVICLFSNLLTIRKYNEYLLNHLIQNNILSKIDEILSQDHLQKTQKSYQKNYQDQHDDLKILILSLLCAMLQCRPLLPLQIFALILKKIQYLLLSNQSKKNDEGEWLICKTLSTFIQFEKNEHFARLLWQQCIPFCRKYYSKFREYILDFLKYMFRHEFSLLLVEKELDLIQSIIQDFMEGRFYEETLEILSQVAIKNHKVQSVLFNVDIMKKIIKQWQHKSSLNKNSILRMMKVYVESQEEILENQEVEFYFHSHFQDFIINCLSENRIQSTLIALKILDVISCRLETEQQSEFFKHKFCKYIEKIHYDVKNEQILDLCSRLLLSDY